MGRAHAQEQNRHRRGVNMQIFWVEFFGWHGDHTVDISNRRVHIAQMVTALTENIVRERWVEFAIRKNIVDIIITITHLGPAE
jgi:hypothetical protein